MVTLCGLVAIAAVPGLSATQVTYQGFEFRNIEDNGWLNGFGQNFQSPDEWRRSSFIRSFESYHNNPWEDRRFKYDRLEFQGPIMNHISVNVLGYQNAWDGKLTFNAGSCMIMDIYSVNDGGRRDRRFGFVVAPVPTNFQLILLSESAWTPYDGEINFRCATGAVLTGVQSEHDNGREDRRWKFQCGFLGCTDSTWLDPDRGTCVATCPRGRYPAAGRALAGSPVTGWRTCLPCLTVHASCEACSDGSTCDQCSGSLILSPDRTSCVSSCPADHYPKDGICTRCFSHCSACSSGSTCSICEQGYFLNVGARSCVTSCAAEYWSDHCETKCRAYMPAPVVETHAGGRVTISSAVSGATWKLHIWRLGGEKKVFDFSGSREFSWDELPRWNTNRFDDPYRAKLELETQASCIGHISEPSEYRHRCDCTGGSNGQPTVRGQQVRGEMQLIVTRRSFCSARLIFERRFENEHQPRQYHQIEDRVGRCDSSDLDVPPDDLDDRVHTELGKQVEYCVKAINSAMYYETIPTHANEGCVSLRVEFFTIIEGRVTAQSATGPPVENVRVDCVIQGVGVWSASVDASGHYSITVQTSSISGPIAQAEIRPSFEDGGFVHRFTCMTEVGCTAVNVTPAEDNRTYFVQLGARHGHTHNVDFIDASTVVLKGKALLPATTAWMTSERPCFLPEVSVCAFNADSETSLGACVKTSFVDGSYEVAVPFGASVDLRASFSKGNFSATLVTPEKHTFREIAEYKDGVDFEVKDRYTTSIHVFGGFCETKLGETTVLEITMPGFCPEYFREEKIQYGRTSIELEMPISDFKVQVKEIQEDVYGNSGMELVQYLANKREREQFGKIFSAAAEEEKGVVKPDSSSRIVMRFQYNAKLRLDATIGFEGSRKCNGSFVVQSGEPVNITVFAWEDYGSAGECSDVGRKQLRMKDFVTDTAYACTHYNGCTITTGEVDFYGQNRSGFVTTTVPGLVDGYQRWLRLDYEDEGRPTDRTTSMIDVLVEGARSIGDRFSVTVSEGNPIKVLYDPPGGNSYASLQMGTTISSHFSVEHSDKLRIFSGWKQGGYGEAKINLCTGVGVAVCESVFEAKAGLDVALEEENTHGETTSSSMSSAYTLGSSISTSRNRESPGRDSDVVMTAALSLIFEKVEDFRAKWSDDGAVCSVARSLDLQWQPEVAGHSVKTIWDIENVEIPKVTDLLEITQQTLERDEYEAGVAGRHARAVDLDVERKLNASLENWRSILAERDSRDHGVGLLPPTQFQERVRCVGASPLGRRLGDTPPDLGDLPDDVPEDVSTSAMPVFTSTAPPSGTLECAGVPGDQLLMHRDGRNSIFFAGGGTEYSMMTAWQSAFADSTTQSFDASFLLDLTVFSELCVSSFCTTWEGDLGFEITWGGTQTSQTSVQTATEVQFTLGDDHLGDSFDIEVKYDEHYNTPFFVTFAGASYCPHERGTMRRNEPYLYIQGSPFDGVPPDAVVGIHAQVINRNPTEESANFVLALVQGTNSKGLQLKVNGVSLNHFFLHDVPPGEEGVTLLITAQRSPGEYIYEGIELALFCECEWSLHLADGMHTYPMMRSAVFDVRFQRYCSSVEFAGQLAEEGSFRVIRANQLPDGRYKLRVQARNPQHYESPWSAHPELEDVIVQYRRVGDGAWESAFEFDTGVPARLISDDTGYAEVDIDVTLVSDGEYEIRLVAYCSAVDGPVGSHSTTPVIGVIDRVSPALFGQFAEPSDGLYNPGDEISAAFTEDIDCRRPFVFDVFMRVATSGGEPVAEIDRDNIDVYCRHSTIELAFTARTMLYTWQQLMGNRVTVTVSNVRDVAGNPAVASVEWGFDIETFDASLTAAELRIRMQQLHIDHYYADPASFTSAITSEIAGIVGSDAEITIERITPGSIVVDFSLQPQGLATGSRFVQGLEGVVASQEYFYLGQADLEIANFTMLTTSSTTTTSSSTSSTATSTTSTATSSGTTTMSTARSTTAIATSTGMTTMWTLPTSTSTGTTTIATARHAVVSGAPRRALRGLSGSLVACGVFVLASTT